MRALIQKAARDLHQARRVVCLTGAGISVESGIPPFRGKGGVWETIDPIEYAHIDAFNRDPLKVWQVLLKAMKTVLDTARPNTGHLGLVELERLDRLHTIITQNVDGLHQAAGSRDVIEFHGNFAWYRCVDCSFRRPSRDINLDSLPPVCGCGGIYRPECIFFGELIPTQPMWRSREAAENCDLMLVVGTSAEVQPAALMPRFAKENGATVVEINPDATPLTETVSDYLIRGKAGEVIHRIVSELKTRLAAQDRRYRRTANGPGTQ